MSFKKFFMVLFANLVVLTFMTGCSGDGVTAVEVVEQTEVKSVATVTHSNGETFSIAEDTIGFEAVFTVVEPSGILTSSDEYTYFRDRTTDVMYVYRIAGFGNASHAGFAAMMDPATGGALTYDNWLKYLGAKNADG